MWISTFLLISVYDPKHVYKIVDEIQSVVLASGLATFLFAGYLYLTVRDFSRWLFVLVVFFTLILTLSWRLIARIIFRVNRVAVAERRVLIIGAGEVGRRVGQMIAQSHWMGLTLAGYLDDDPDKQEKGLPVLGKLSTVREIIGREMVDDVVVALPQRAYGQVNKLVLSLHDMPVNVRVVPDYFSLALYRATVEEFGGLPMINLRDPALNSVQRLVKRLFDLVIGSFFVLLMLPILSIVALLIKFDSSGPIFFRQQRVGENGRIFQMVKFRTMIVGAEKLQKKVNEINGNGELIHKKENDPRVTRIGRLLRRTSLDELPQLFNVIKGDMSLVGPRPEMPWLVDHYEPWQHKRFAVPQGITGWWQVNGRSDKPMHLHTEDDIYYIQNYSLWMDLYILIKTPFVVLRGKGAY
ncbi:MAG: sugar transferase [Ardenticatenaceae bacterium]|nr:sugar transferase [Ardenticatenaceae bacterium]